MPKLLLVLACACALSVSGQAASQSYPSRPITMVVPLATGGSTDVIGRLMVEGMRATLGQPVIVENTAGAGGTIGVGRVARTAPDGYTFLIGQWGTHVASGAIYPLQFDLLKDLEPIALIATQPFLIVSRKTLPANNLKESIAWLKANKDKAMQGNSGIGTPSHVAGIMFQTAIAPDIPTTDEAGLPGFYFSFWHVLWAPKGTPKDIIAKLNEAVAKALNDPVTHQKLIDLAQEIFPREQLTPETLAAFQKGEIDKWWPIIQAAGIKAQ